MVQKNYASGLWACAHVLVVIARVSTTVWLLNLCMEAQIVITKSQHAQTQQINHFCTSFIFVTL